MPNSVLTEKLGRDEILEFLISTPPFDELTYKECVKLSARAQQAYYPAGTTVLTRGKSEITHLALIHTGRVKLLISDEDGVETVFGHREKGQAIGALGILRDSLSNLDVAAVEDTLCLLIAREDFRALTQNYARFSQFYLKVLSESYVGAALTQLRRRRPATADHGSMFLFGAQVGDIVRRKPVVIPRKQSVKDAAEMMTGQRVGSLLVSDDSGEPVGIITDRDLRKVLSAGLKPSTPVEDIMTAPLRTIPSHTVCFDALLEMMNRRVHHLVVEKNGRITGMLSGHDLMVLQGSSPLNLVREINMVSAMEDLYDLALKSPRVMHGLILEGARPGNITRLITLINDHILDRLLGFLEDEIGPPPVPYCWLLMGSEGRKEQTFKTDQDNGLIYADPAGKEEAAECERYFRALGNEATRHLVNCGFPRCKGDIMASNPKWCQPISVWKKYFDHWITTPEPKDVLHATIFFDFRPGYGQAELGLELRRHLMAHLSGQELFLRFLAKDCMTTPPALGLFKRFSLEKDGPFRNRLDLKTKGLVPFVDFARIMSLRYGVKETNTQERLQAVADGGFISRELYLKLTQAYEIQMVLRLLHQDRQWEDGVELDNYVDPSELSELERNNLKEALSVVGDIRSYLREEFQLISA